MLLTVNWKEGKQREKGGKEAKGETGKGKKRKLGENFTYFSNVGYFNKVGRGKAEITLINTPIFFKDPATRPCSLTLHGVLIKGR